MSLAFAESLALSQRIEQTNFFRRGATSRINQPHREWFHFSLGRPELTLVLNLSVVEDLRQAAAPDAERCRVVVLVRDGRGWDGDAEEIREECAIAGGQILAIMGPHSLRFQEGAFRVVGSLRHRPVSFEVAFHPVTHPLLVNNVGLGEEHSPIHWLAVPRLTARGWVLADGRRHELRDELAYHDHNWGRFSHRNVSWQWGHALPSDPENPYSVVLARLMSRGQGASFLQTLVLWRGSLPQRVFRDEEVRIWSEGRIDSRGLAVPRCATMLAGGANVSLPRRLHFEAQRHGDFIRGSFEAVDLARIVVPHELDLDTTVIHEVFGAVAMCGRIASCEVEFRGHGLFEFLGAGL